MGIFKHKAIAPLLVLIVAAAAATVMIAGKPPVQKKAAEDIVRQVRAMPLLLQTARFPVTSQGVVLPLTHIRYLSEVSGKIVEVSPKWADGGFFRKGEVLLTIEDHVYKSQLAKADASIAQAESTLTQEKALAYVAEKNWQAGSHANDDNAAGRSLALREPQQASAQAQLTSARADRVVAEHNLEKTRVRAPFDGIINNKLVDIGQVVGTGQQLADFYGTARAEIRVPLTQAQQQYLSLPTLTDSASIAVEVLYRTASGDYRYPGKLTRTGSILDENTRVLHGIVEVNDPYGLNQSSALPPLPLGAFVEISINSEEQQDIVRLPSRLLRPGNRIWVVDPQDKLQLREVVLLPSRGEEIFIRSGLQADDRIIVSSIVDAHPGNPVQVTMTDQAEP